MVQAALGQTTGLVREKLTTRITAFDSAAGQKTAVPAAPNHRAPINLLANVDLDRDAMGGKWTSTSDGVACVPDKYSKLRLPYKPTGDYDFHVQFTRAEGNRDVAMMLYTHGKQFAWLMGAASDSFLGFDTVAKNADRRNESFIKAGLTNGHRYDCVVQVRSDGLTVYLDGNY